MPGVIRTRVGYCGGTTKKPTYDDIGDHAETIQIDFDPRQITYEQLLKVFAASHNLCRQAYSRQYMSAIWFHNERQRAAATAIVQAEEQRRGEKVLTEIAPLSTFTLAEDYHQKYYLQSNRVLKQHYRKIYPDLETFVNSTAAARVNAYLTYSGTAEDLQREFDALGLAGEAEQEFRRRTERLQSAR